MLILDTLLSICFIIFQTYYILFDDFTSETDKTMQIIIGFGITGGVFLYAISDAIRFLPFWCDRILYIMSCMLMKPILLPVLLPGSVFRSPLSNKPKHRNVFRLNGIEENEFMLAV